MRKLMVKCNFENQESSVEYYLEKTKHLRVVITTRRLSVASSAIDHPFLGRNNNK
jgi:hypothetical protein